MTTAGQPHEWNALYLELRGVLASHGREGPFGNGEFWLVDDNYGSPQHKVCVFRVAFLTQPLCREVQRVIRKYSLAWEVIFAFDFDDGRRGADDFGVTVTKSHVEACWDAERMAHVYGTDFRWTLIKT